MAVCDRHDSEHAWASRQVFTRVGAFIVTSAAVAEATHLVKNYGPALDRLRELVERMQVEDPAPAQVLEFMRRYTPEMDYADACAVLLARGPRQFRRALARRRRHEAVTNTVPSFPTAPMPTTTIVRQKKIVRRRVTKETSAHGIKALPGDPFAGSEHVFGSIALPRDPRTRREILRARYFADHNT